MSTAISPSDIESNVSTTKPQAPKRRAPSLTDVSKLIAPSRRKIGDVKVVKRPAKTAAMELNVHYGLDPELTLYSLEQKRIVSAIPVLKCDKHNPIDLGDGVKFHADNTLAEFSMRPETTGPALVKSMRVSFQKMQDYLGKQYRLLPKASHVYPDEDLVPSHSVDPMQIGCEDSFLCWGQCLKPTNGFVGGLRTGSFHLHLGHAKLLEFEHRLNAIKLLDIYLGLSSVVFDKDETARARRALYGVSGEHRLPIWGIEYRVMGPFALRSPALVELVIDIAEYALDAMREGRQDEIIGMIHPEEVERAINTCDVPLARRILTQLEFPKALMQRVELDRGELDMYREWSIKV